MNCPGCGFELRDDFAFCPKCGAKQEIVCAGCGHACPPDFAFCPKCGTRVGAAPVAARAPQPAVAPARPASASAAGSGADRRTVTVLFADLSGFSTLSEKLDPEEVRALQNELFAALSLSVKEFGGFVEKFVGDAMLAMFGAPVAHENDPERALRAALDMMTRVANLSGRWRAKVGAPLALHVGVNTGPVVAGAIGAGDAQAYAVTGDTVNTAQRLQSLAASGEILVGPATHRLARHAFAFAALGEVTLKGKIGGVTVHRLEGPLEAPREVRGLEALGLTSPLIGRDVELKRMLNCLDIAVGGAAQLVRLVGEAGVGKSRLVTEFLARVRDEAPFGDLAVRRVACSSLGEQPYGAIGSVLRIACSISPRADAKETRAKLRAGLGELDIDPAELERLMPLFLYMLGLADASDTLRHMEPEQVKRQIFYAIRTAYERRLAQMPMLLVVEDLHFADAVSLEALKFLIDRLDRSRLMLVVTQRMGLADDPLTATRASNVTIRLGALPDEACRELLAQLFAPAANALPDKLIRRILERAGGNPLYIEETVRALIEAGALVREGNRWRLAADPGTAEIPLGLQALLLARVDRLPRAARRLAEDAAIVGARFDADLLREVTAEPGAMQDRLDLLIDSEIVEEESLAGAPVGRARSYRFTQSLIQDVIYQSILVQRRSETHGRVGAALRKLRGDAPDQLEDLMALGHHFGLSADKATGVRYLTLAAERARSAHAAEDAVRLYEKALAAQKTVDPQGAGTLEILESLGDLSWPLGRREIAREYYEQALTGRRAAQDRIAQARLCRKLAGLAVWDPGKRAQAEALYAEAQALLEGSSETIERAHLCQELGRVAFRRGDHAAAAKWAEHALECADEMARDIADDSVPNLEARSAVAGALNTLGIALARMGKRMDAIERIEQSVFVAESSNLFNAACRGYSNLGALYSVVDPKRAIEVCREGLEVATRIGDLGYQSRLYANLAVAYCTFTDRCTGEGVPAAKKSAEIDLALGQRDHLAVPLTVLGQIYQCHDRPDLAQRYYGEALEIARELGDPQLLFPCYDGLATLSLDRDDAAEAERYMELAQKLCDDVGLDPTSLILLPFLD